MLGAKYLQGCMFAFIVLSALALVLEGSWLGTNEDNLINNLNKWSVGSFSWFSMPIVFASVIWHLPDLLSWDYSFFTSLGAAGGFIRLFLGASISFGIVWGFVTVIIPAIVSAVANMGGGIISLVRRI